MLNTHGNGKWKRGGKMGKERKKFRDTAVGKFLRERIPDVADAVGDVFPPANILKAFIKKENLSKDEELKFLELLHKYETEDYANEVKDRKSARELQSESIKSDDKFTRRWLHWFATLSISIGFVYVFLITFIPIPENNQRFADTILGVVISLIFSGIYNFFFGSSKGSSDKTELLKSNFIKK